MSLKSLCKFCNFLTLNTHINDAGVCVTCVREAEHRKKVGFRICKICGSATVADKFIIKSSVCRPCHDKRPIFQAPLIDQNLMSTETPVEQVTAEQDFTIDDQGRIFEGEIPSADDLPDDHQDYDSYLDSQAVDQAKLYSASETKRQRYLESLADQLLSQPNREQARFDALRLRYQFKTRSLHETINPATADQIRSLKNFQYPESDLIALKLTRQEAFLWIRDEIRKLKTKG